MHNSRLFQYYVLILSAFFQSSKIVSMTDSVRMGDVPLRSMLLGSVDTSFNETWGNNSHEKESLVFQWIRVSMSSLFIL